MKNTVLKYGTIGGLIITVLMVGTWSLTVDNIDNPASQLLGYTTMVIALSMIFVGVKSYRDKELEGKISFGKAFLVGLYISLLASAFYVLTWMIMYETIAADFMTNYSEATIAKIRDSGASMEEIEKKTQELATWTEYYKNPLVRVAMTLMEILPVGIIVSLIAAAILKKSK